MSGRQHVGYVSGDKSYAAARDRVQGAREVLDSLGMVLVGGDAFYGSWTEEWGRGMARLLLEKDPQLDAVLCGSDQIARGVIDALRDLGKDIPTDIAVMGHDNWEPLATQSRPPLSTIDMNLEALGRTRRPAAVPRDGRRGRARHHRPALPGRTRAARRPRHPEPTRSTDAPLPHPHAQHRISTILILHPKLFTI